ncbi:site-specific DNA-methyltransferase [Gulosibacter sediminis]|uniref:site-specific DNA-methyltransferase n=1 Tax=Gulosibacter sediminis TaxID=1729695 RepID=UPI0024A95221|nr:site-specific DNA-methyltransferase [Gulosibacter sediminis]
MEKRALHSPDLTARNIARIAELFPQVMTESRNAEGNVTLAVDFDLLRQELSDHVVDGPQERYQLDWPGKRAAAFAANAPIAKTLRPVRAESVDFDTTKNLFIEGDNLEALKLLQESYLGKVKLIYIDPPYNTGNDFVYEDDFAESSAGYLARSRQKSETGDRLVANTEANGRFHSDWLSMMYPRLKLARNLLRSDGVLLVSIDDTEVANLRLMLDEIFGRANLVTQIAHKARASVSNDKIVSQNHNHILLYARDFEAVFAQRSSIGLDPDLTGFSNPDDDPRGAWKATPVDGPGGAKKGNPFYEFLGVEGYWRYSKETMSQKHAEGLIIRTASGLQQKYFLAQARESRKTVTSWWDDAGLTSTATRRLTKLMDGALFDTPKPVELLSRMLDMFTFGDKSAIVLDFFAGSATTGHAVMLANAQDGGHRRFVLVQLDETPTEKSEAAAAGYESIASIARERLRRAAQADGATTQDVGFRSLHIFTTNMADTLSTADDLVQISLTESVDSVKPDRTDEDLLFQVLLDWGLDLAAPITVEELASRRVLSVDDDALIACFAKDITDDLVNTIAARHPLRAVFLDAGFATDAARINAEQIFREVSPETEVRTI